MPNIDFAKSERAALARFLREAIDADRFPLSPRVRSLKAILAKVDPQPERPVSPLATAEALRAEHCAAQRPRAPVAFDASPASRLTN